MRASLEALYRHLGALLLVEGREEVRIRGLERRLSALIETLSEPRSQGPPEAGQESLEAAIQSLEEPLAALVLSPEEARAPPLNALERQLDRIETLATEFGYALPPTTPSDPDPEVPKNSREYETPRSEEPAATEPPGGRFSEAAPFQRAMEVELGSLAQRIARLESQLRINRVLLGILALLLGSLFWRTQAFQPEPYGDDCPRPAVIGDRSGFLRRGGSMQGTTGLPDPGRLPDSPDRATLQQLDRLEAEMGQALKAIQEDSGFGTEETTRDPQSGRGD